MTDAQQVPFNGVSMWPFLRPGDTLFVEKLKKTEELVVGDIVLFRDSQTSEWVAHRIIHLNPMISKGDRAQFADSEGLAAYSVVTGWKRGEKVHIWGSKGQFFKRLFSFVSRFIIRENPKAIRYLGLFIFLFFSWVEVFLLAKKHRT